MKARIFAMAASCAFAAAAFEKIALVDNFDFGAFFDLETEAGEEQVMRHAMETGCDRIWWRVMSGAVPRYRSAEESSPSTVPPFDLLRLPLASPGGWTHFERMPRDLFGIFKGLSEKYGVGFGAHWTVEEAHWCDWSVGAWNLEHPQYWCRNEKMVPWPGKASLAFPEVLEHKLRLVDEILATGVDTIYIDTCRYSGWTPSREFVKPNIDRWRALYGDAPLPLETARRDERWLRIVAENEMRYLREIRRRMDRFSPRRRLALGVEEAGRSEADGGDFMWHERALDWRRLAAEGTVDDIVVICVRIDKSDPWNSARRVYDGIVAAKGRAKVYFPVRMYDFWNTSHGIPTFMKATGLDAAACGAKLLEMARDAGGDGVAMECVDFNNYPKELRETIRAFGGGAAPGVASAKDAHGEDLLVLSNRFGRVELSLRGAQIRSLRFADGGEDLLFRPASMEFSGTADNRGGIPVCWPWFGRNGEEGSEPHGFARYSLFEERGRKVEGDLVSVTLGLPPSGETRAGRSPAPTAAGETRRLWPHECDLEYTVELGRTLNLSLRTRNTGRSEAWITEGLHPYWRVSDRRQAKVRGLSGMPYCFADETTVSNAVWRGDFTPDRHYDHVFWRGGDGAGVEIVDPAWRRAVRVSGSGYGKYVIWTPGDFKAGDFENLMPENAFDFVCVEPATLFRVDGYALKPGESHTMRVSISLAR